MNKSDQRPSSLDPNKEQRAKMERVPVPVHWDDSSENQVNEGKGEPNQ